MRIPYFFFVEDDYEGTYYFEITNDISNHLIITNYHTLWFTQKAQAYSYTLQTENSDGKVLEFQ